MIWFDIKNLEEKLIENEISERTGYHYLLAFLIIITLAISGEEPADFTSQTLRFLDIIIGLIITIWGTGKLFEINNKGNNRDFLKRYFSLCFVHTSRIVIVVFLITLLYNLVAEFMLVDYSKYLDNLLKNDISELVFNILFQIVFYFLVIRSFKKVNRFSENTEAISA